MRMVKCQFCWKEVGKGDIVNIIDSETQKEIWICLDCYSEIIKDDDLTGERQENFCN